MPLTKLAVGAFGRSGWAFGTIICFPRSTGDRIRFGAFPPASFFVHNVTSWVTILPSSIFFGPPFTPFTPHPTCQNQLPPTPFFTRCTCFFHTVFFFPPTFSTPRGFRPVLRSAVVPLTRRSFSSTPRVPRPWTSLLQPLTRYRRLLRPSLCTAGSSLQVREDCVPPSLRWLFCRGVFLTIYP